VHGLDFIMKLRPVTYNYDVNAIASAKGIKDSSNWEGKYDNEKIRYTGFIAQEVEATAGLIGYEFSGVDKPANANSQYGIRYGDFVMPLVKAVQEQQQQIDALKKENAEIKVQLQIMMELILKK
ncbi:MAG: tail fiber domain-containing protein, partial [Ferruginibacter sp.]